MIHEDLHLSPMAMHAFVESFLRDLELSAPKVKEGPRRQAAGRSRQWIPPLGGASKINVDGAVAKSRRLGAASAVCRSPNDTFLGAAATVYDGVCDPGCLEALACHEGVALAYDLNLQAAMIGANCLEVAQGLQDKNLGRFSSILQEIRDAATRRGGTRFRHEGRASNDEAHRLAKMATTLPAGRHVWLGTLPEGLNFHVNIVSNIE
jgi:hypothetical protein